MNESSTARIDVIMLDLQWGLIAHEIEIGKVDRDLEP